MVEAAPFGDLARRCWAGPCSTGGPGPTTAGSAAPSLASARLPAGRLLAQSGLHSADVRVLRGRCSTPSLTAPGPAGCFAGPRGGYGLGAFGKKVTTHVTAQTPRVIYLRPEELTNIHLFVKTERLMIAMGM